MNLEQKYENVVYGLSTTSRVSELSRQFKSYNETLYNIQLKHGKIFETTKRSVIKQRTNADGSKIIWESVNIDTFGNIRETKACTIEYTAKNGEKWRFIGIDVEDNGLISNQAKSITIEHCKPNQCVFKQKVASIFVYDEMPQYISNGYQIVPMQFANQLMQYIVIQPNLSSDQTLDFIPNLTV